MLCDHSHIPLYCLKEKEKKIETIACFLDRPFIIILSFGLDLPLSLMIFWIFSILFVWRFRKTSLILRTSLMLFPNYNIWAYNLPLFLFLFIELVILKYLEIFLTSLGDLAGIGSHSLSMLAGLFMFFSPFFPVFIRFTFGVHLKNTFYLKELLSLSAISKFHSEL